MSLLGQIGSIVSGIGAPRAGGILGTLGSIMDIGTIIQTAPSVRIPQQAAAGAKKMLAPQLPSLPGPGHFTTGGSMTTYSGNGCPSGYHPAKDGSGRCVRNRRMNSCNPRALNRAVRRIKSFRRMAQKVERSLPKQRTTRAPRRVTHSHRLR